MRKFGFVFAAAAVLGVISASLLIAPAQAQQKTLWQGWVDELQKIGAPPPPPAKAPPPAAPAKMKDDKKK
jgi:hypothetical protein